MSENIRHLLTAFADEVLEWNLENSWGSGASTTFDSIVERYTCELQALTTYEGCSVPISSLLKLLLLLDPTPVDVAENEVMVFKNPKAANVLTQISAEVRGLIAPAQKGNSE